LQCEEVEMRRVWGTRDQDSRSLRLVLKAGSSGRRGSGKTWRRRLEEEEKKA